MGIALGGIRRPDVKVPIALNTGWNAGGIPPTANGSCQQTGTHIPFDAATLRALYPKHRSYVKKVTRATNRLVRQGFVLPEDAHIFIEDAEAAPIGK